MYQEPTELLWTGCLTGLILILTFRFDTLIPDINSQTFWPKVIPHVTNGIIFFICSSSAISAPFAALRIPAWQAAPKRWRRGCRNRREKKIIVAKSKTTAMNLSSHVPTSSSSAKSPIASENPGILHTYRETWKTEDKKFKIRRSVEFPSEAARCIPWPVDGHSNGETCRYKGGIRGCGPFRTWNMEHEEEGTKKQLQGKLEHRANKKTRGIPKLKENTGQTTYTFLQPQCLTRMQSSRS